MQLVPSSNTTAGALGNAVSPGSSGKLELNAVKGEGDGFIVGFTLS
jgi:hypothetical protein